MIKITLPDGSLKEYKKGVTPFDVARDISEGLARNVLSASFNGHIIEVESPLNVDGNLTLFTWESKEGKKAFWHSTAHVLAQVIEEMYKGIKLTIGPAIENGFYYDIDFSCCENSISEKDFPAIEKRMLEVCRGKHNFTKRETSKKDALAYYEGKNEFKTELIENLNDGEITFCDHDTFTDLCRGGHIPNTGFIKAIKLLSVAGAYWRGDENKPQLTRIYGISFPKQKDLKEYLIALEEAKKRDHRKLGKELELFTFSKKVGQGLPLWLPKGAALRERLEAFLRKAQKKAGYEQVVTPHIGNKELYVTSGHFAKYGKDSFQPILTPEGEEYLLKPMNCPHHCEIFNSKPWSYKDLPKRFAEFGTVYRYEQSGELHGLTRVRCFTQDDAHIFCTQEQLDQEFKNVIDLVLYVFGSLGFKDFVVQVSVRDPENLSKYIGEEKNWNKAEEAIINAAKEKGLNYVVETGEAAFYGPKLDFMVKDALGRSWQLGTIQVDYNLPERFELSYKGSDNDEHRPVMIHRAPFGSMERFVAVLLEHTGGNFPLWLMPEQVVVLSVSEKYESYTSEVLEKFELRGVRAVADNRNETIGKKIREAEKKKIPYIIIVGEEEESKGTISVRKHGGEDIGVMPVSDFCDMIDKEVSDSIVPFGGK